MASFSKATRDALGQEVFLAAMQVIEKMHGETEGFWPIDAALHRDELGGDHVHVRGVYIALDRDGNAIPRQKAALQHMGYERPNPSAPEGRYNNNKITFTRDLHERFLEQIRLQLKDYVIPGPVPHTLADHVEDIQHHFIRQKHLTVAEYKEKMESAVHHARNTQHKLGWDIQKTGR